MQKDLLNNLLWFNQLEEDLLVSYKTLLQFMKSLFCHGCHKHTSLKSMKANLLNMYKKFQQVHYLALTVYAQVPLARWGTCNSTLAGQMSVGQLTFDEMTRHQRRTCESSRRVRASKQTKVEIAQNRNSANGTNLFHSRRKEKRHRKKTS